jgi:uncharacterized protein YjiS (DUF1127 family)
MTMRRQFLTTAATQHDALPDAGAAWRAALWDSIRWSIDRIRARHRMRRGVDELTALDDRMLADIGISRSEILYSARFGRLPNRGREDLHQYEHRSRRQG